MDNFLLTKSISKFELTEETSNRYSDVLKSNTHTHTQGPKYCNLIT